MNCPNCNAENRPTARFCLACGQALPAVPPDIPPGPDAAPGPALDGAAEAQPALEAEGPPPAPSGPAEEALPPVPPVGTDEAPGAPAAAGAAEPEGISGLPCAACGAANRADAKFCAVCGQPLAAPAPVPPAPPEPPPLPGPEPAPGEAPDVSREQALEAGPIAWPGEPEPGPAALDARLEAALPAALAPPEGEALPAGAEPAGEPASDAVPPAPAGVPEAAPPVPLAVGSLVAGRYQVLEVQPEAEGGGTVYAVADLGRCWHCDWTVEGGSFCLECGADVSQPPPEDRLHLRETAAPPAEEPLPADAVVEAGRLYSVLPRRPAPPATPFAHGVRLVAGRVSDSGQVRELNEDSVYALTMSGLFKGEAELAAGLYIVADGIGGSEAGEWASRLGVQVIASVLLNNVLLPMISGDADPIAEAIPGHLRDAVEAANEKILNVRTCRDSDMGTTVTLALVLDDTAYVANVGDSRTYLWGVSGLEQVTQDHSIVARLVASGMAEPDEIYTHPQRSAIYRSLGDKRGVEIDVFSRPLAPGNALVLCSDGVWDMVRNEGLEGVLLMGLSPQATCDELLRQANQAGGEDNISAIVVHVEPS